MRLPFGPIIFRFNMKVVVTIIYHDLLYLIDNYEILLRGPFRSTIYVRRDFCFGAAARVFNEFPVRRLSIVEYCCADAAPPFLLAKSIDKFCDV